MPLAEIYPLVTARALARPFTYEVADDVERGAVVSVGLGGRRVRGVVVDVGVDAPDGVEIAAAGPVVDRVPAPLVELALWLAEYYGSTPARTLALVAPHARARRGERRAPAHRDSLPGEAEPEELTPAQREAVARIVGALDEGGGHVLLHGPTGSGKTEVYLRACAAALERGKGAIVLVPEIALTPQTVGRFAARFGDGVAVLHSALTDAERRDERERIASGEARVVVGARSAVFAPVRALGLLVVDEEHDASFKQESDPRYDARTVAAKRAALEGAVAVYGSATPRAESWARLERLELPTRIGAPDADGSHRRSPPRGRLPALRAAAGRAGRSRGAGAAGRSCCSTGAESPERSIAAPAESRAAAGAATSRSRCTGTSGCTATTADTRRSFRRAVPSAARSSSPVSARGRSASRPSWSGVSPGSSGSGSTRTPPRSRARFARR